MWGGGGGGGSSRTSHNSNRSRVSGICSYGIRCVGAPNVPRAKLPMESTTVAYTTSMPPPPRAAVSPAGDVSSETVVKVSGSALAVAAALAALLPATHQTGRPCWANWITDAVGVPADNDQAERHGWCAMCE
jgi:hypothetical protein